VKREKVNHKPTFLLKTTTFPFLQRRKISIALGFNPGIKMKM